jgi:acyl-CoA thioesterase-1
MTRRFIGLFLLTFLAGVPALPQSRPPSAQSLPKAADVSKASKQDTNKILLVFGDSLSAGYGLAPGQSFPDALQRKLDAQGYHWRVVNMGISGDTTMGGIARLSTATVLKPALVLLELGGNDGLRGLPLTNTRENLDQMITAFQRVGARVVLAGMTLPPNYGPDYVRSFEKIYSDLAAKYRLSFIPFLLQDIVTRDMRFFQRDGIHPNREGAEIVSDTVLRTIKPLIGAAANN